MIFPTHIFFPEVGGFKKEMRQVGILGIGNCTKYVRTLLADKVSFCI